jgi:hypothetical protein
VSAATQLARTLHVEVHLLDQSLGRGEATFAPQALQELDPQLPPVEIGVRVEQVSP